MTLNASSALLLMDIVYPKWYYLQEERTVGPHSHHTTEVQAMLSTYPIHAALPAADSEGNMLALGQFDE